MSPEESPQARALPGPLAAARPPGWNRWPLLRAPRPSSHGASYSATSSKGSGNCFRSLCPTMAGRLFAWATMLAGGCARGRCEAYCHSLGRPAGPGASRTAKGHTLHSAPCPRAPAGLLACRVAADSHTHNVHFVGDGAPEARPSLAAAAARRLAPGATTKVSFGQGESWRSPPTAQGVASVAFPARRSWRLASAPRWHHPVGILPRRTASRSPLRLHSPPRATSCTCSRPQRGIPLRCGLCHVHRPAG